METWGALLGMFLHLGTAYISVNTHRVVHVWSVYFSVCNDILHGRRQGKARDDSLKFRESTGLGRLLFHFSNGIVEVLAFPQDRFWVLLMNQFWGPKAHVDGFHPLNLVKFHLVRSAIHRVVSHYRQIQGQCQGNPGRSSAPCEWDRGREEQERPLVRPL